MGGSLPVNLILNRDEIGKDNVISRVTSQPVQERQSLGPSPVIATGLSGGGVFGSLDSQAGRPFAPSSSTRRCLMPSELQRTLLPESGGLPSPFIIKGCGLTFIQVDVVLPFFLVPCAVISGALEDVSPVPNVMADGHLL